MVLGKDVLWLTVSSRVTYIEYLNTVVVLRFQTFPPVFPFPNPTQNANGFLGPSLSMIQMQAIADGDGWAARLNPSMQSHR